MEDQYSSSVDSREDFFKNTKMNKISNSKSAKFKQNLSIIDSIYQKQKHEMNDNFQIMEHHFRSRPQNYQTSFKKNLHAFAQEEIQCQKNQLSAMFKKQRKLLEEHASEEENLKKILSEYQIKIGKNQKLAYDYRIQKNCLAKNYFYNYKKKRIEILQDQDFNQFKSEAFHTKFVRLQKEQQEKLEMIEAKKRAIMFGNNDDADRIELNSSQLKSQNEMSGKEKLAFWMEKMKIIKKESPVKEKVLSKRASLKNLKSQNGTATIQNRRRKINLNQTTDLRNQSPQQIDKSLDAIKNILGQNAEKARLIKFNSTHAMNQITRTKKDESINKDSTLNTLYKSAAFKKDNLLNLLSHHNMKATQIFSRHHRSRSDKLSLINNLTANQKQLKNETINQKFKEKTPSLKDYEIQSLLRQYPVSKNKQDHVRVNKFLNSNRQKRNSIDGNLSSLPKELKQTESRKKLFSLMHVCKHEEDNFQKEMLETEYKQLKEQIKEQEFDCTLHQLREIEFAEPSVMPILYQYKLAETNDNIKLAEEIAKDYSEGKADPRMAWIREKNTKSLLKKGILLR
ncbi:UNKNOWN [Stylonychia lemnae]|uniref:Uncharacterized protein n=1 Tax=Stylonychia lemnae TaxID=5949 RepID=A0A078B9L5_STYLE|nr:UNKNOWN [Stylonychia lemnae]|eukprot:CDW90871.1 UNKNOWN [Stylonychia lemnae]